MNPSFLPPGFNLDLCRAHLIADEGKRNKAYKDSLGIITIGIGRNIQEKGLSDAEVEMLFQNDLDEVMNELDRVEPVWRQLPPILQDCMVNLMFNMGATKWLKFVNTRKALNNFDYEGVAIGLENSKWYTQVQPSRRDRIVNAFRAAASVA